MLRLADVYDWDSNLEKVAHVRVQVWLSKLRIARTHYDGDGVAQLGLENERDRRLLRCRLLLS